MTAIKAYNLECDGKDCPVVFDDTTWPEWQTAAEVRKFARRAGWKRLRDGRDLCPDCVAEGADR